MVRRSLALASVFASLCLASPAHAEPTEPVVIGWWSYFDNTKIPTTSSAAHPVSSYGDPDTYYYEPSGAFGMQEDPAVLPPDQAWQTLVSYVLAKANGVTLSSTFTINTSSDLQTFTQAYYGWALLLLYVPKDKYCDSYQVHIGTVDDGVQVMTNGKIVGYANLGEQNKLIDMVEQNSNPPSLVLRPGINEVVLIHEDQAAVERYVTNVWIEHNGAQVDLAPKNIAWGRVQDATSAAPLYDATVGLSGNGVTDSFLTGPYGFYFFSGLADGTYDLTADAVGYATGQASVGLTLGQGVTEVVRTDLPLMEGCSCPDGTICGPSGGCLVPCVLKGELGEDCDDPAATCVEHYCVTNPCDTLTCAPGFYCEPTQVGGTLYGQCIEIACSNVCCGVGEVCSAGLCVPDTCGEGCPGGQTCSGGSCVDSCTVVNCVPGLECQDGVCITPCEAHPESCGGSGGFGFGGEGGAGTGVGGDGAEVGAGGAGANGADGASDDDAGCGCEVPRSPGQDGQALALLGLGLGLALRRRSRG